VVAVTRASGRHRPTLAEQVARFCLELRTGDIPVHVLQEGKLHFLDGLGVALAAASLRPAAGLEQALARLGGSGDSTAIGFRDTLPAAWAALLNGTLVHSLEYDDTHTGSVIHGSSLVLPAVFAAAESARRSGADALASFVAGWEALIRLGAGAPGAFQARGFQTTAVCGPFVAAAVAARLSGLTLDEATRAVGIAGSQASGVFAFLSDGSTVKSLHPGWAAHAGLVAAALAAGGMTGPGEIFETAFGFYRVFAGASDAGAREALATLGTSWELPNASVKLYPCCHFIHPFLECTSDLMREHALSPDDIASIECLVPVEEAPIVCDPWERRLAPGSGYEAKFSLPYCIAALAVDGRIDVDTFAQDPVSVGVTEFAHRVSYTPVTDSGYPRRFPGHVRIVLRTGARLERSVEDVRGGPRRPLSSEEVVAKFLANATRRLPSDAAHHVLELVMALETLPDLEPLAANLRMVRETVPSQSLSGA
jgi:2-methylcitrate dehydratase PrpD